VRSEYDGLPEMVHCVLKFLHVQQDVALQQQRLHVPPVERASLVSEEERSAKIIFVIYYFGNIKVQYIQYTLYGIIFGPPITDQVK
jgi:hypothetical protein